MNQYYSNKLTRSSVAVLTALSLAACGGGGSDEHSTSFTGQAADGYLQNAKACLDINENKVCDSNEPFDMTDELGKFVIEGLSSEEAASYPIVVEVTPDTIDMDSPNQTVDGNYSLTAPVGYTFISPLSTMVKSEVDNLTSLLPQEAAKQLAEAKIKQKLGLDLDLNKDYIEKKASGTDVEKALYTNAHTIAQVAASILKETQKKFDDSSSANDGINPQQKLEWIAEKLTERIEAVADDLHENTGSTAEQIITSIGGEISLDVELAKSEIDLKNARQLANATELFEVVTNQDQGGYHYGAWLHNSSAPIIRYDHFYLSQTSDGHYVDVGAEYELGSGNNWIDITEERNHDDIQLTSHGWQVVPEHHNISINQKNGRVTITNIHFPEFTESFTSYKVSLQDKNIADVLSGNRDSADWVNLVNGDVSFTNPASALYQLSFTQEYDDYSIWSHDCSNGHGLVGETCYQVWIANDYAGSSQYAVSLDDLITDSKQPDSQARGPWIANVADNGPESGQIFVELVEEDHTAHFYLQPHWPVDASEVPEVTLVATSTWEMKVMPSENGEIELLVLSLPPSISRLSDGETHRLFTEYNQVVHQGELRLKGSIQESEVMFNGAAHAEILAAFTGPVSVSTD